MTEKTLVRSDLYSSVSAELDITLAEAGSLVDTIIEDMIAGLAEDGELKLSGFGTFMVHQKKERIGRNPKTGKTTPISARNVLLFNASNLLKAQVNQSSIPKQKK